MPNYNLSSSNNYIIYTDQTGSAVFDTGGPSGNYGDNENLYVLIAPAYSTGTLTLNVTSFTSEASVDYLRIYNSIPPTASYAFTGTTPDTYLIRALSGTPTVPLTLTSSTGKAYLRWSSDASLNYSGFAIQWTGSGFYNVDSSSNVTTNKYAVNLPLGTSGSYVTFDKGIFTGSSTLSAEKDIIFGGWIKADRNGLFDVTFAKGIFGLGSNNGSGITITRPAGAAGAYYDANYYYRDTNGTFNTTFANLIMGGLGASSTAPPSWHQYGFALRKTSTAAATIYAYRDGYLFASSSVAFTGSWGALSSSSDLVLGSYRASNIIQTSINNTWSGSFDDVFMATVTTGAAESVYTSFFASMYNSGNWADPNSVITGAFTSGYTPRVLFNWRFEETGSVLNTRDYGFYGNVHSASSTGAIGSAPALTPIASGISYTPYSSLAYSASVAAPTNATIVFTTSSASVYENTSSYFIGVSSSIAASGQAATASVSITSSLSGVTASFGTDYRLIYAATTYSSSAQMPILVSWADGETGAKYITASIIDNTTYTGTSSSINLSLSNSSGVTVGSPSFFTLSILDYEEGNPSFTSSSYGTGEASGSITIYVDRLSGSNGPLSASYSTANGTAIAGTSYTTTTGTLSWNDAETTIKSFSVPILFDGVYGSNKAFTVNLSSISTGSFLPYAITSSTITIADQEQGTFSIESSSYAVIEGNSTTIKVNRYSGSFGAVNVNITSSNGTAFSGTDYNSISQTLVFANGETSKTLTATTIDNGTDVIPPPLYFTVGINSLTPEYLPLAKVFTGTNPYTTVYITDNETGSIRFTNSSFTGAFGSTITIPVERYAGADFSATASISRVGGTSTAGVDYTDIFPYTVTWTDQESGTKNISLTTLTANLWDGDKTLQLQITGLTNLNIGSIMTSSILFSSGITQQSTPPNPNISADFTINNFTNASSQYTRRVEQVPFRYGINGPATIRGSTYKVTKG